MGTMRDPSPQDLADTWTQLAGDQIDPDALASLVAAIQHWPTGRLATGADRLGPTIIVSWQRISGFTFVTMR